MQNYEVRNLRTRMGISQAGLGQLLGRTRQTIGDWEKSGVDDPAVEMALRSLNRRPEATRAVISDERLGDGSEDLAAFLHAVAEMQPEARQLDKEGDRVVYVPAGMRDSFPVKALRTMDATTGSALIPGELAPQTDEPLQEAPVLQRLGAQFIQLGSNWPGKITAATDDPDGQWLDDDGEGAPMAPPNFEAYSLQRHTLRIGPVAMTRPLRKQTDAVPLVMASIRRAMLRDLAAAAIAGDGVSQPQGLVGLTGITTTNQAGTTTVNDLLDEIEALEGSLLDVRRLGFLAHPGVKRGLAALAYGEGFAWMNDVASPTGQTLMGLPAATSTHVPEGSLILGDWSQLRVYHDQMFDLSAHTSAGDTRTVYGWIDADARVVHPAAFRMLENVVA